MAVIPRCNPGSLPRLAARAATSRGPALSRERRARQTLQIENAVEGAAQFFAAH